MNVFRDSLSFCLCTRGEIRVLMILIIMLPACNTISGERAPMPDSMFVEALAELHRVDAARYLSVRQDSLEGDAPSRIAVRDSLPEQFRQHPAIDSVISSLGYDRSDYVATIDYYLDRPADFVTVYNRVLDRLNVTTPSDSRR